MITVTLFTNSADNRSVDAQGMSPRNLIPPSSSLYGVISLHTELRDVRRVQERPCTHSTGIYTDYGNV